MLVAVVMNARAEAPPSLPILCDPERDQAMLSCATENSLAMQDYMARLTNSIVTTLSKAEAESFQKANVTWQKATWKRCTASSNINYPEDKRSLSANMVEEFVFFVRVAKTLNGWRIVDSSADD